MREKKKSRSVEDIEIVIGRILQIGVLASAFVIFIGLVMFMVTGNSGYPGASFPSSPEAIIQGLISIKPYTIMIFGLVILILTPVLRVGISILVFIREKDGIYQDHLTGICNITYQLYIGQGRINKVYVQYCGWDIREKCGHTLKFLIEVS